MTTRLDATGMTFSKLTAIEMADDYVSSTGLRKTQWVCLCECGNKSIVAISSLRNGNTKSCGCLNKSRKRAPAPEIKCVNGVRTKEYEAWIGIRQRCLNPKNKSYKNYGGRGITLDERWNDYFVFFSDMGKAPSPSYSVERKNNNLGYSPENCCWATRLEQSRNRRTSKFFVKDGVEKTMKEWCEYFGVSRKSFQYHLSKGHDFNRIHASFSKRAASR